MQKHADEREDLRTPKISVCVAAYNVEPYLVECLDSLGGQSLRDAQFIIVDDGSTDGTGAICEAYAHSDPRFHVVHHEKNQGLMVTRKTGIEHAQGEYLIFLDGDDRLSSSNVLSSLVERLVIEKVDVLRFCVECFGEDQKKVQSMQKWLSYHPIEETKETLNVLKLLFDKQIVPWSVWSQAYRTEIAKKATEFCPNEKQTMAEDVFWSFVLISLAKSYKSIQTDPIYSYRVGTGISTTQVTLAKFDQLSMQCRVVEWIHAFVDLMHPEDEYQRLVDLIRTKMIQSTARSLIALPKKDRGRGFELFIRWGHQPQVYEAIRLAWIEGLKPGKLYSFEAFKLWVLGRIAFTRETRRSCRAKLIQLIT